MSFIAQRTKERQHCKQFIMIAMSVTAVPGFRSSRRDLMKILVPVDGSPASIRVIKLAIVQVKTVAGASLVIVNIQNPATLGGAEGLGLMPPAWLEQEEKTAAMEAMQQAVTTCRERQELLTWLVQSVAPLPKRSIMWHARKTWRHGNQRTRQRARSTPRLGSHTAVALSRRAGDTCEID
jgi:hypothetical protein